MRTWTFIGLAGSMAAVLTLSLAGPAAAGGWAVTTLDQVPSELRAGETLTISYTIRQHGQSPFAGANTAIELLPAGGGAPLRFAGHPDGEKGHYVARVTFPSEGEWKWRVDQAPFAHQALGVVTVLPAVAAAEPALATEAQPATAVATPWAPVIVADQPAVLRFALPLMAGLATLAFGWRLVSFARNR
jgi:hypothetical protein